MNIISGQHLSAGVVIVREVNGRLLYLLLRAHQYWDFPKGLVEDGEEPLAAAEREVEEETTLTGLSFRWGYDYYETLPYGRYQKIARYYIAESAAGEVDLPVSEELGHPEHEEYRWLDYAAAQRIVTPRVKMVLEWSKTVLEAN